MAVFELEMNGRVFEVEAPSMDAAMSAFGGQRQQQYTPRADPALDIAKSAGIGAARSAIGLADIPELGARGIDWATNKVSRALGMGEVTRPGTPVPSFEERWSPLNGAPETTTNEQFPLASPVIQRKIEETTGPFYRPQTPEGRVAERAGGFALGMIGGPAGIGTRAITNVAAPFAASEAAGALTEGTAYQAPAQIAAALASPSVATRALGVRPPIPQTNVTADDLLQAGRAAYQSPAVRAVQIQPQSMAQLADRLEADLIRQGFRPRNAPQAFGAIDDLRAPPAAGPAHTVADLDSIRRNARDVAMNNRGTALAPGNRTEVRVAENITNRIDDYLANLRQSDLISGNARQAAAILGEARANYGAGRRSEQIARAITRAEDTAARANSGSNVGNRTKQEIGRIFDSPQRSAGYNAAERAQARTVDRTGRAARYAGNMLGGGGGWGALLTALGGTGAGASIGAAGGPIGMGAGAAIGAALPVIGKALKGIEGRSVQQQARMLEQLVRSRSPLAQSQLSATPEIRAILARLLVAPPAVPAVR